MKSRGTGLAAFAFAVSGAAMVPAQAETEQEPGHTLSYNLSVVSDYRFRGVSQTRRDPALQAGADYTHTPTGLYAGTWLSNIHWTRDAGGGGNVELDVYGGKRGEIAGVSYDAGLLYYIYPSNRLAPNGNTLEGYAQLGYGPAYIKYSHAPTHLFGTADSKHSSYLDVGANVDLGNLSQGLMLLLHLGRAQVRNNLPLSYTDYKFGLSKDLGVATVGLAFVKANTDAYRSPRGENLGRSAALLTVSKTF